MVLQNAMLQKYVVVVCTPEAAGEEKVGSVLVFLKYNQATGVFYLDSGCNTP